MKNFKPGQKVVFKRSFTAINQDMTYPENNSVVVIKSKCPIWTKYEAYDIEGFEFSLQTGRAQSFGAACLFPIEEREQEVTLAIKKIKLEPKKVLEKTEELLHAN